MDLSATIDAHSKAIGALPPFIFYPLLTGISACMGVKASVNVNTEWTEPMILCMWTVVAARKGEKKTPACHRLTKAIQQLEKEMQEKITADLPNLTTKTPAKMMPNVNQALHPLLQPANYLNFSCIISPLKNSINSCPEVDARKI